MKYNCPKCRSALTIQKTFNQKIMISCEKCTIVDLLEYTKNTDEVYLDFLTKYDEGKIPDKKQMSLELKMEGIIRDEKEIKMMIGSSTIDELTKSVLYSKKDYISIFKTLKNPPPKLGCKVGELGIDENLSKFLQKIGIEKFYKFQEDAIKEIAYGSNVVIEAPTASGKTEAFVIPVLQKIKEQKENYGKIFALFVYPTKALAKDQFPKILDFAKSVGITVGIFDGDTKQSERAEILDNPPQLIITNFDILHYHLWHRTRFASLLSSVKYLVTDEVHVYSGIFGSNVHYIIKRLKRICNKIQFVAASATLENAVEFCEILFGEKMKLIHGDGKKGETDFLMLFPSLRTQRALMVDLIKKLTSKKHKTMVFSNSHKNSELVAMQARKQKVDIKVHRAGLMAN